MKIKNTKYLFYFSLLTLFVFLVLEVNAYAQNFSIPSFNLRFGQSNTPEQVSSSLQILALLTILTLAPALLILTTSFTRIVIVLGFLRNAIGMQQSPPNQVILGLALFLTFFIMSPVWSTVNKEALQPYMAKRINQTQAWDRAVEPLKQFMVRYTRKKDLALFVQIAKMKRPKSLRDVPIWVVIPAYAISELKTAFQMGFIIYLPFLVIDMVVASVLMAMGMMMMPPIMVSLPFKIMLFVLVDGWYLITSSLVHGFTG